MSDSSDSSDSEEDCLHAAGQQEPLTRRLRNILREYAVESLFKEFLQNAEDAGGSRFRLTLDRTSNYPTELLLDPGMRRWHGPALWMFNDALFSEKDWQGIQSLSRGGKGRDENLNTIGNGNTNASESSRISNDAKIGRHGLGFNSVYNVTDVPSVLSGDKMLFLDPHAAYLADAGTTKSGEKARPLVTRADPGLLVEISKSGFRKKTLVRARDQFLPFEKAGEWHLNGSEDSLWSFDNGSSFPGTLFRAPLRGSDVKSEISDAVLDITSHNYGSSNIKAETVLNKLASEEQSVSADGSSTQSSAGRPNSGSWQSLCAHVSREADLYLLFLQHVSMIELAEVDLSKPHSSDSYGTTIVLKKIAQRTEVSRKQVTHFMSSGSEISSEKSDKLPVDLIHYEIEIQNQSDEGTGTEFSGCNSSVIYDVLQFGGGCVATRRMLSGPGGANTNFDSGRLFCRLPMDMGTGCSAHISALFWPSSDRRTLYLQEDSGGELARYCAENKRLLRDCAHALCWLIRMQESCGASSSIQNNLNLFPRRGPTPVQKFFTNTFYSDFVPHHPQMHRTIDGKKVENWRFLFATKEVLLELGVKMVTSDGVSSTAYSGSSFYVPASPIDGAGSSCKNSEASSLLLSDVFGMIGIPLVLLTSELLEIYCETERLQSLGWRILSSQSLRDFLREVVTHNDDKSVVSPGCWPAVFRLCTQDNQWEDLAGLPLCMFADGTVGKFASLGSQKPIACVSVSETQERLLRPFKSKLVASLGEPSVGQKLVKAGLLAKLDAMVLRDLLADFLENPAETCRTGSQSAAKASKYSIQQTSKSSSTRQLSELQLNLLGTEILPHLYAWLANEDEGVDLDDALSALSDLEILPVLRSDVVVQKEGGESSELGRSLTLLPLTDIFFCAPWKLEWAPLAPILSRCGVHIAADFATAVIDLFGQKSLKNQCPCPLVSALGRVTTVASSGNGTEYIEALGDSASIVLKNSQEISLWRSLL